MKGCLGYPSDSRWRKRFLKREFAGACERRIKARLEGCNLIRSQVGHSNRNKVRL